MFLVMDSKASCRCCLLRPPDKDLFTAYVGQAEIYAEMFKECFSIQLNECLEEDNGICDICVGRLQDACDFKAQVQQCQIKLANVKETLEFKEDMPTKSEMIVEEEPIEAEYLEDMDDFEEDGCMDVSVKEAVTDSPCLDEDNLKLSEVLGLKLKDVTIKRKRNEKEDIVKTKRTDKGRNVTVKRKRNEKKDIVTTKRTNKGRNVTAIPKRNDKGRNLTAQPKLNAKRISAQDLPIKIKNAMEWNSYTPEIETVITTRLQLMNNILNHSNATPFYTQDLLGIICIYCKNPISNIQELRNHIKNQHKDALIEKVINLKTECILKLDITDLQCDICSESLDTIDSLMKHLADKHKIENNHKKDCIFEFKLTAGDSFDCALCNATFERFKSLLQHMHTHSKNYVCDVCGSGFINKPKLTTHKRTHETGSYACKFCEKTFATEIRKRTHERYIHSDSARFTTNCPHCDKSFNNYYWKNRHLKEDHNISSAIYKCNSCDKSFALKSILTEHVKKVHLKVRNKICQHCGRGFYNNSALDNHLIKHEGSRIHKCKLCIKTYTRMKALKEHMRIHSNDRRFKCALCGLAFIHKYLMKSHMVSKHGITLADYEKSVREKSVILSVISVY